MTQDVECLVCGSNNWNPLYDGLLIKCQRCDFITANMKVDASTLQEVYTENYFKGEEYLDYLEDQEVQRFNFAERISSFQDVVGHEAPNSMLEIGCAYGLFGDEARSVWPDADYVGYDVVPEAVSYAKDVLGLNAKEKDYLHESDTGNYDAVFMWDVIEHLQHPEKFLEKIAAETVPGGHLCITTGDIGAMLPKLQGRKWRQIHPPSHLHYFSKRTLTNLLESKGFEVRNTSYPSIKRSVRLIFFGLFMLNRQHSKWMAKIHNAIPSRWRIGVNTFDIIFIIAQKKN